MKWIFQFLFLIWFNHALSQTYADINKQYQKFDAVVLEKLTDVNFLFNEKTGLTEVIEKVEIKIMGLNVSNGIFLSFDYDENSEIKSVTTFPSAKFDKMCGNVNPEGIFHSGLMGCIFKLRFRNPGEVITFKLTRHFFDAHFFNEIYYTTSYPVLKSTNIIHKPFGLEAEVRNFHTEQYNFQTEESQGINEVVLKFTCSSLPGKTEEKMQPPVAFFYPHTLVIPKKYNYKGKAYPIFENLDGFYAWCYGMACKSINNKDELKEVVNEVVSGKTSDIEKLSAIFSWVQDKIRYIAFEHGLAGYVPEAAQAVYKNKYGDCKGMANLLKIMLNIAGIDARLTWVGTSDIPYDFTTPSLVSVNHMVCTAIVNGQYFILDATDKYARYNQSPATFLGKQILIEDGEKYILYNVPPFNPEKDLFVADFACKIEDNRLDGFGTLKFFGLEKSLMLGGLNSIKTDERQEMVEKIFSNNLSKIKSEEVKSTDLQNKEQYFEISGKLKVDGQIIRLDDEIYIHPDIFEDFNNYFIANGRVSPYYFDFPKSRKSTVRMELPPGFKLKQMPKNFSLKNEFGNIDISYVVNQDKISYEKHFHLSKVLIPQQKIKEWNEFIKQYKTACSQQIVISK